MRRDICALFCFFLTVCLCSGSSWLHQDTSGVPFEFENGSSSSRSGNHGNKRAREKVEDKTSRNEILSLPGFSGAFASKMHSGFVTVDKKLGSHLFYILVESEKNPTTDPLVLWLNGGPGCSSFDGFIYEQGPFNFEYNGGDVKLKKNPYAWSKVANMIFLDSPAGVGLSYSKKVKDRYHTNDTKTTEDLRTAVVGLLKLFPEFKSNRFFVTGESYAGIYIPVLTDLIVEWNKAGKKPHVNLQGYAVGNGVTDQKYDGSAYVPFARGKSLISQATFDQITKACNGSYWKTYLGSTCFAFQLKMFLDDLSGLNRYNVAGDCEYPPQDLKLEANAASFVQKREQFLEENGLVWPFGGVPEYGPVHNWRTATGNEAPCTDYWTGETWMNNPKVREAIHAAPKSISGEFFICSPRVSYKKTIRSTLEYHRSLIYDHSTLHEVNALIYSGDHDLAVPHTGSEAWTQHFLGEEPEFPWQSWRSDDYQVSGYFVESKGLIYCTIRNAGHMVPSTHPPQALDMFTRFITNLSLVKPEPTKEQ